MHMRLASAPEQLLNTADYSLNDAFDGKASTHADSAAHYSAWRAWRLAKRLLAIQHAQKRRKFIRLHKQQPGPLTGPRMGPKLALAPLGAARKALLLLLLIIMCDNRSMKQSCALCSDTPSSKSLRAFESS